MEEYYQYLKSTPGLLPAGAVLNVTGYSLGGHLATTFTELHWNEVNRTYTFNPAGRGGFDANVGTLADMIAYFRAVLADPNAATGEIPRFEGDTWWNEYQAALAAQNTPWPANLYDVSSLPGAQPDPRYRWALMTTQNRFRTSGASLSPGLVNATLDAKITQLYGHATQNDSEWVANSGVHATPTKLFIEDQPDIQNLGIGWFDQLLGLKSDYGATHSITLLADALAVMSVFEKLGMPTQTASDLDAMYSLLGATSNQRGTGFVFSGGKAEGDSLEQAVEALAKLLLDEDLTLQYDRDSVGGFGDLTNRNQFYAALDRINTALGPSPSGYQVVSLVDQGAYVLKANAYGSDRAMELAYRYALKEGNPFALVKDEALYAPHNLNGALDLYDPATRTGTLTEEYLTQRARFLERKLYYNAQDARYDTSIGELPEDSDATRYDGEDIVWDDRAAETTIQRGGTTASTRYVVFGSDSPDTLTGKDRDDYLFGGSGNDALTGGQGNDYLEGGQGTDLYYYAPGDGHDTIVDQDKKGVIVYDPNGVTQALAIGLRQSTDPAGQYKSPDNTITYQVQGSDLLITTPTGTLTVANFNKNTHDLQIHLLDLSAPATGSTLTGNDGNNTDDLGLNPYEPGGNAHNDPDIHNLVASADTAAIYGLGGHDTLIGNDRVGVQLYGGTGHDILDDGNQAPGSGGRLYGEAGGQRHPLRKRRRRSPRRGRGQRLRGRRRGPRPNHGR